MPNWCENHLWVTGPKQDIQRFVSQSTIGYKRDHQWEGKGEFTFGALAPPATATVEDQIAVWGTKWDITDVPYPEVDDSGVWELDFQTAWGPPERWLLTVSGKFPTLTFVIGYIPEGDTGAGLAQMRGGLITREEEIPGNDNVPDYADDDAWIAWWEANHQRVQDGMDELANQWRAHDSEN